MGVNLLLPLPLLLSGGKGEGKGEKEGGILEEVEERLVTVMEREKEGDE